jgi:hypothetical protein
MYGEPRVREAYQRYGEADRDFVVAFIAWRHAAQQNLQADRGEVPAHDAVSGEELVRRRKAVEAARDHADEEYETLVAVVARAVGRMPRYQRRAWRRLEQPKAD